MNKFNKIGKILFFSIWAGYIVYLAIKTYNDQKARNINPKYTIGIIEEVRSQSNGDPIVIYKIKFKNESSKNINSIYEYNSSLINKRFYVKFEAGNPDNCEILLDKPVPDSIKEAPPEGWDEIPY